MFNFDKSQKEDKLTSRGDLSEVFDLDESQKEDKVLDSVSKTLIPPSIVNQPKIKPQANLLSRMKRKVLMKL